MAVRNVTQINTIIFLLAVIIRGTEEVFDTLRSAGHETTF